MSEGQGGFAQEGPQEASTGGQEQGGSQQTQQVNDAGQQQQKQSADWGQNDFLKNVDEADRPSVEKYLKMIDAGISRRFQGIHDQYRPYKELGVDPEQLQQAVGIMQMLNDNPQDVLQALQEALAEENTGSQGLGTGDEDFDFQGLPPQIQEKLAKVDQMEQALQAVAQHILGQQEQTTQQQADQQLDQTLTQLHSEFGEFDEEYVLAKAYANGGDLAAAVTQYNAAIQKAMTGQQQMGKMPPILGGGGVVPQDNSQSVKSLSRSDTQALVERMLAANSQG